MVQILRRKRGKTGQKWELLFPLNQSGSGKLVRSQNYVRKISLTVNASSNASIDYNAINECNQTASGVMIHEEAQVYVPIPLPFMAQFVGPDLFI